MTVPSAIRLIPSFEPSRRGNRTVIRDLGVVQATCRTTRGHTIDLRSSRGAAAKATRHSVAITEGSPTSSLPTGACSPTYDRPVPERPFASVCRFGVRLQFGREQAFASLLVSAGARGG